MVQKVIDETDKETLAYKYSITSYGADFTVQVMVSKLDEEVIFVPRFQRSYVWNINQASRFIESLLLGLPVPGIFLSREMSTQKLLVIDGQQRLKSLHYFYKGVFKEQKFRLKGVQSKFEGQTYDTLAQEDKLRLDDAIIHATIVRQDEPSDDESSVYHIFERLNTGGTLLQPQEIRACIYHGGFRELLDELRNDEDWQRVYGRPSDRLKDEELILRFLGLYFDFDNYKPPMKEFLNIYMGKNRNFNIQEESSLKEAFKPAIRLIAQVLGARAFRPERTINAAVYDAVMVGLARRLSSGPIKDKQRFKTQYNKLLRNSEFIEACKTGTSQEKNVRTRVRKATEYFHQLK